MTQLSPSTFASSMENLLKDFRDKTFLLAVSGGVDSMVLAHLFHVSGLKFQVAHLNYKLRGRNSDDDHKTVEDFCKKHQIRFHVYEVCGKDKKPDGSVQLWARNLRYRFFRKIQEQENLEYLVTAHHLNDQLETFLINLSRGSGLKGLSGIPANKNQIMRPLLSFSKDEIYRFAEENAVEFREDASNQKSDYLRNKIRNEIVPKLLETNTDFLENFNKSLRILTDTKDFVEIEISRKYFDNQDVKASKLTLSKNEISAEKPLVQYEIFNRFGFDVKQIEKILNATTGSIFHSPDFMLAVNRDELILEPVSDSDAINSVEIQLTVNDKKEIIIPDEIKLQISGNSVAWNFDDDKICLPLILRHKKEGDVFFPVGMTGRKKVSKFFKDEKISILAKPKIWLLCDAKDQILGILPYRQDRRFAANGGTQNVLKLKI